MGGQAQDGAVLSDNLNREVCIGGEELNFIREGLQLKLGELLG